MLVSPYVFTGWRGGVDSTAFFIANQFITYQKALSDFFADVLTGQTSYHWRLGEFASIGDTREFGDGFGGRP